MLCGAISRGHFDALPIVLSAVGTEHWQESIWSLLLTMLYAISRAHWHPSPIMRCTNWHLLPIMCSAELDTQVHRDSVTWQQKSLNRILKQLREGGEAKNLHGEASLALHILRHTPRSKDSHHLCAIKGKMMQWLQTRMTLKNWVVCWRKLPTTVTIALDDWTVRERTGRKRVTPD
jgi:hypothetical protein